MALVRLQKLLAAAGGGSRRQCETLITEGRVLVDGRIVSELGSKVDPDVHDVRLDGEVLRLPERRTWLFHKPKGVICSAKGRPDMPMVGDYAPPEAQGHRLFTVGRLDVESEGAILLTNDGELCHLVSHPRFGVEKTYRVEVRGVPDDATLEKMAKGVWLAEGRTGPLLIRCLETRRDRAVLEVRVKEGMKREIRRVCARFGHEVVKLLRVAIGPVRLGHLPRGATRPLTDAEEQALRDCADVVIRLGTRRPTRRTNARSSARAGRPAYAGKGGTSRPVTGAAKGPRGGKEARRPARPASAAQAGGRRGRAGSRGGAETGGRAGGPTGGPTGGRAGGPMGGRAGRGGSGQMGGQDGGRAGGRAGSRPGSRASGRAAQGPRGKGRRPGR